MIQHQHQKAFLLTFDVEEFDLPSELGKPLRPRQQIRITADGVEEILRLLDERSLCATFFITARFAHARPEIVRAIVTAGHEAGVHGLLHRDDYAVMDPEAAFRRLRRAREIVETAAGEAAVGVRLPRLRGCSAAILREAGFRYDATPHPTWVPGRYCGLHLPRSPWREEGMVRVPISVVPGLRFPVSWLWYRLAGRRLGPLAARLAALRAPYLHLYFHAWETREIRRYGVPVWLARGTGRNFLASLRDLSRWGGKAMAPMTVRDFVAREGWVS